MGAGIVGLDSTSDEIANYYGYPIGYLWRGKLLDQEPAAPANEPAATVYGFVDHGVEYQLRVVYYLDNTTSNFHATLRVQSLALVADHAVPISDGLRLLPGAAAMCNKRCSVARVVPGTALLIYVHRVLHLATFEKMIQIYRNDSDGRAVPNSLHDLNSDATIFALSMIDYRSYICLPVKGGWLPPTP